MSSPLTGTYTTAANAFEKIRGEITQARPGKQVRHHAPTLIEYLGFIWVPLR